MNKEEIIANARTLKETNISGLGERYQGKVRDCYTKRKIIQITTDRVSSFDYVLSRQIPFKGQVLTEIMCHQGGSVADIIPYHVIGRPDPQVVVVHKCKPYDVEFIIRGYLTGSLLRDYKEKGPKRAGEQYGIELPEGLKPNQKFDEPIVTPTTKAKPKPGSKEKHHDEPVSKAEIISPVLLRDIDGVGKRGEKNSFYIEESEYDYRVTTCLKVFNRGQVIANKVGLILVDTKYELGYGPDGEIMLIDEVHTPDSSRFWYLDTYLQAFETGKSQKSLSKEFVREWLIEQGYDKTKGESSLVELTDEVVAETSKRYIELCEIINGKEFVPGDMSQPVEDRIKANLQKAGLL